MLSGHSRGLTPTMKRELKRRSAIEPMIGHAKCDGRLGRNWLLGPDGDKINALLAAAGHNLRLILRRLALLLLEFWALSHEFWRQEPGSGHSAPANRRLRIHGSDQAGPPPQWLRLFSGRTNDAVHGLPGTR